MSKIMAFASLAFSLMTGLALADAGNVLIAFSSKGPDTYADGQTVVKDGEWYALVWTPNATFGGFDVNLNPVNEDERVMLAAPLAKDGGCPTVVFQVDSKNAPTGGKYLVYLLDTRGVSGAPSAADENGKPQIANGLALMSNAAGEGGILQGSGLGAWNESDAAGVGNPVITDFRIVGENALITVKGLAPKVRYTVVTGATVDKINMSDPVALPQVGEDGVAVFGVEKNVGKFFRVTRQPINASEPVNK